MIQNRLWTEAERDYLRDYYGVIQIQKLASRLQRSIPAVRAMARNMGLKLRIPYRKPRKAVQILLWNPKKKP